MKRAFCPRVAATALAAVTLFVSPLARAAAEAADVRSAPPGAVSVSLTDVPPSAAPVGCWLPSLERITARGKPFLITRPGMFIAVATSASAPTLEAAEVLSKNLERITGQHVGVRQPGTTDATARIVLGTVADLPEYRDQLREQDQPNREAYLIRSETDRLSVVANSDNGIGDAVWDLLHQLGYRHYFPGPIWRVVPHAPRLEIQTERLCRPAFQQRAFSIGGKTFPENEVEFAEWGRENRLGGARIATGHSYDAILRQYAAEFAAHPEYLGRTATGPSTKFCVNAPGLVDLVRRYAARHFQNNPDSSSVSLEPSDGGGWEGCPVDASLGSPSNRALTLANAVAQTLPPGPDGARFVGMYAYNEHSAPPTIRVHPQVAVFVATAFLRSGLSFLDTLQAWRAAGLRAGGTWLGVRDYYAISPWDRDRPGMAAASSPEGVAAALAEYYAQGARLFLTEMDDGWGPHGLGYWVAAASLWTADQPAPTGSYVDDFLRNAFGKAHSVMREFYARIDRAAHPLLCPELVGELSRLLARARTAEPSSIVGERIAALGKYLHYLDLWLSYAFAEGPQRQSGFEALMRYTYRIRGDHMVHGFGLRRSLASKDRKLSVANPQFWKHADQDPWRDTAPVTKEMAFRWIAEGSRRPAFPSPPAVDPQQPLQRLRGQPPSTDTPSHRLTLRGTQRFHLLSDEPGVLRLGVKGGGVRSGGVVRLLLHGAEPSAGGTQTQVLPADRLEHEAIFQIPKAGSFVLDVDDARQGVTLSWPSGTALGLSASQHAIPSLSGIWTLYLYVPAGTRELVLYSDGGGGVLRDPTGKIAHRFARQPGIVRVPIPAGLDARPWQFDHNTGYRLPLNVPPWLAAAPDEIVLPRPKTGHPPASTP